MKPAITIEQFKEARKYMSELVPETLANLEIGIYDVWLKYLFEEETKRMIRTQFKAKYPDIDVMFSFSIYLSQQTIEYSVQRYYHPYSQHIFLGSVRDKSKERGDDDPYLVDCYYSRLYEAMGEPRVIVRHGHAKKECNEGAMSAAEQFYQGFDTTLAKAYQLALEAGYVK
jgi:hypothetical protein